uniref:Uncharacterized protein n=1 Tax=Myoviridae sp. ctfWc3 TaxID=2827697 RepID=A0A8S5SCZ6_9CAUD|nr:MAG TPA: hypothetical protein [Myoviridae sp. ctfWc3]
MPYSHSGTQCNSFASYLYRYFYYIRLSKFFQELSTVFVR